MTGTAPVRVLAKIPQGAGGPAIGAPADLRGRTEKALYVSFLRSPEKKFQDPDGIIFDLTHLGWVGAPE